MSWDILSDISAKASKKMIIRPNGITTCDSSSCIEQREKELDKAIAEKLGYESLEEFNEKDPLSR